MKNCFAPTFQGKRNFHPLHFDFEGLYFNKQLKGNSSLPQQKKRLTIFDKRYKIALS